MTRHQPPRQAGAAGLEAIPIARDDYRRVADVLAGLETATFS
jgi:hypothetical protein